MPHALSNGHVGATIPLRTAPSVPPHSTPEARIDALIALLRQANERQRAQLRELADDLLGEWIGEQFADLIEEHDGGTDARAPQASTCSDAQFEADWQRFLAGHPNHIDLKQAYAEFGKLRLRLADPDFHQDFFEKLDDWHASAAWRQRKFGSPYWYLKNEQWIDDPLGPDGRPAVGQLKRQRLAAEAKMKLPLAREVAAALKMPPAPPVDRRTPQQIAIDGLLAALNSGDPDLIAIRREAFLFSGGKPSELHAIETDHAKRTRKDPS